MPLTVRNVCAKLKIETWIFDFNELNNKNEVSWSNPNPNGSMSSFKVWMLTNVVLCQIL